MGVWLGEFCNEWKYMKIFMRERAIYSIKVRFAFAEARTWILFLCSSLCFTWHIRGCRCLSIIFCLFSDGFLIAKVDALDGMHSTSAYYMAKCCSVATVSLFHFAWSSTWYLFRCARLSTQKYQKQRGFASISRLALCNYCLLYPSPSPQSCAFYELSNWKLIII